jgi:hypothetical protein
MSSYAQGPDLSLFVDWIEVTASLSSIYLNNLLSVVHLIL